MLSPACSFKCKRDEWTSGVREPAEGWSDKQEVQVSHVSANSVPQTRTASSAAWERTTHLVSGSCKRKLDHVQTCLGTWVCLTYPSDTLRPFRELNCWTFYVHGNMPLHWWFRLLQLPFLANCKNCHNCSLEIILCLDSQQESDQSCIVSVTCLEI
jgi:hypothetical protein